MEGEAHTACSHCGRDASLKCGRCKVHVYCNKECQKEDWKTHKAICNEIRLEKVIERAADTLQKIYFAFREKTFDNCIRKVEDKGTVLVLHDHSKGTTRSGGFFQKVPNHLFKNEVDRKAALTVMNCNEPWAYLRDIFTQLTEGLDIKIEELDVKLKNIPKKTMVKYGNGHIDENNYAHSILRITSVKSGNMMVVDVTGPQYGMSQSFWKWHQYKEKHVEHVVIVCPFGNHYNYLKACAAIEGNPGLLYTIGWCAAKQVNEAVKKWSKASNLTLARLLRLDDKTFDNEQTNLVRNVAHTVGQYVRKSNFKGLTTKAALYEIRNP
ncbi:hypothetical protein K469DRAFT_507433, partial [Zopfia rhizophila CBS 207.26]